MRKTEKAMTGKEEDGKEADMDMEVDMATLNQQLCDEPGCTIDNSSFHSFCREKKIYRNEFN